VFTVSHNGKERHTGVSIEYYDIGSRPQPVQGTDQLNTSTPASYKIIPYAQHGDETLRSHASLEFLKPEGQLFSPLLAISPTESSELILVIIIDAFLAQWALTGQHVVAEYVSTISSPKHLTVVWLLMIVLYQFLCSDYAMPYFSDRRDW
jgi:hypothetical protein